MAFARQTCLRADRMRVSVTVAAIALCIPAWSATPATCPDAEANGVLSKFRQYILPAPDAPEHRWMVSKAEEGWRLTEYSGLRVLVRCRPVSKADELNGFQYGEVEFRYDAS